MKISVAMTTYNSEKYLEQQLDSIIKQTRLPDEIIISDDCSQDNTVQLLRAFKHTFGDYISIKLLINEENIGYAKNFEKTYYACTGDIIVSCDADDIWLPSKVEELEAHFVDSSVSFVFSDAIVVDAQENIINDSLYKSSGLNWNIDKEELLIRAIKRRGFPWGMSIAFKRELLEKAIPFSFAHDGWLWMCSLALPGKIEYIDLPLVKYRRHVQNTSGNNGETLFKRLKETDLNAWFDYPVSYVRSYNDFKNRFDSVLTEKELNEINKQILFRTKFIPVVSSGRIKATLSLLHCWGAEYKESRGNYHTLIADMIKVALFRN